MRSFSQSHRLYQRAKEVIPAGIPGHQDPRLLVPGKSPCFVQRAEGCRFWDVDGNEYIDYMCAYGPVILGYNHPSVEQAVEMQKKRGNCFNLPSPLWVELAETLVETIPAADWVVFGKNGSDAVNHALRVARAHTGKRKVLMAEGAYHGIGAWCTPSPEGVLQEERAHVLAFPYNDESAIREAVHANREDLAALVLTPFRHEIFHDQELPTEAFLQAIRELCDESGPLLIMDDVRAGFRLHLGGSAERFGLRPHLTCFSKAMGNGYPISACVGQRSLMESAERVFFAGSFFSGAVPMAAALATLRELHQGAFECMQASGIMLREGILEQAKEMGLGVNYTGPATMPFMTFNDDPSFEKMRAFCAEAYEGGVFFHPYHNWFLSAAHTPRDIDETLEVTRRAFQAVRDL